MTRLTVRYDLNELPSSQHRAGLAGLVMTIDWLNRQPGQRRGIAQVVAIDRGGATIELDASGVSELFDSIYAASSEEVATTTIRKKNKVPVAPIREEVRSEVDSRGKTKTKSYYYYPIVVPRGGMLLELDPTLQGDKGLWIKLWRDAVWSVFRGVPAQRTPYDARAAGKKTDDAQKAWKSLTNEKGADDLSSTYFLGAQASTAENVAMRDRNRLRFLLHFWPFAVAIYVPNVIDNKGERRFNGYAIAVPDLVDLKTYVEEFPDMLRDRDLESVAYRPRSALVDVVEEVGLDVLQQLRTRISNRVGRTAVADLVLAVDVVHLLKEGNNIRVMANLRIDPGAPIDEYHQIRGRYWDVMFRQARLRALVARQPWYNEFGRVFSMVDYKLTFGREYFRRDAREAFKLEAEIMADHTKEPSAQTTEALVYRVVGAYLGRKLESKYGLKWKEVENTAREADYKRSKEKLAKDAFLAVRSRVGGNFVEYFAGTLCSVPQHVGEEGFRELTRVLLTETDTVRTLTLLALSARA